MVSHLEVLKETSDISISIKRENMVSHLRYGNVVSNVTKNIGVPKKGKRTKNDEISEIEDETYIDQDDDIINSDISDGESENKKIRNLPRKNTKIKGGILKNKTIGINDSGNEINLSKTKITRSKNNGKIASLEDLDFYLIP